ncbi:hypothetical protein ACEPAG_9077 [Sanghuangporus baumii]
MTGIFDKLKKSKKQENESNSEPSFSIQPHPATTNNPADLQGGGGGGLQSARDPAFALHNSTPGIVIPENLGDQHVASEGELQARAAELNKQD